MHVTALTSETVRTTPSMLAIAMAALFRLERHRGGHTASKIRLHRQAPFNSRRRKASIAMPCQPAGSRGLELGHRTIEKSCPSTRKTNAASGHGKQIPLQYAGIGASYGCDQPARLSQSLTDENGAGREGRCPDGIQLERVQSLYHPAAYRGQFALIRGVSILCSTLWRSIMGFRASPGKHAVSPA